MFSNIFKNLCNIESTSKIHQHDERTLLIPLYAIGIVGARGFYSVTQNFPVHFCSGL